MAMSSLTYILGFSVKIFSVDLIWFSGFRGEDLNVIFYQNMPNFHNRSKSTEKIFTEKPRI
jgi:hypothetical protein